MATCGSSQQLHSAATRPKSKTSNPTLENVAEEVLNGIMCHYEPPDPNQGRRRGILRRPSGGAPNSSPPKKQHHHGTTSLPPPPHRTHHRVRWEDQKVPTPQQGERNSSATNKNDPPAQTPPNAKISCSGLGIVCYEAGMEAGCVPDPESSTRRPTVKKKQQMDAQQAIAVAKAKSPRHNGTAVDELVFDEDGNFAYSDPKKRGQPPPPPPPPPPPRERELFLPQICGARMPCGDGGGLDSGDKQPTRDPKMMNLRALASLSSSFDTQHGPGSALSPDHSAYYDDDDEINSLLDGIDDEEDGEEEEEDNDANKEANDELLDSKRNHATTYSARKTSRKSSMTTVDLQALKESLNDWESHSPASSLFRRVFPGKKSTKQGAKNEATMVRQNSSTSESDIGERRGRSVQRGRSRSRSRSPFRKKSSGPDGGNDRYQDKSMSPSSRSDRKASIKQKKLNDSSGGLKFLKGLSPRSKKLSSEGDWDDSIPIIPPPSLSDASLPQRLCGRIRSRSRSPKSSNTDTIVVSDPSYTELTAATRIFPLNDVRDLPPRRPDGGLQTLQPQVTFPAHHYPIHQKKQEEDDAADRMSFITAHRQGFEEAPPPPPHIGTQNSLCGIVSSVKNDEFDRQSFITAHRQTFDDAVEPKPNCPLQQLIPPPAPISDDVVDRQSFITVNRQEFAEPINSYQPMAMVPSVHPEGLRAYGMIQPPTLNGRSVDESFQPPLSSPPKNGPSRRNRSKSPRSRSRSPPPRRSRSPSRSNTDANTTDHNMMGFLPGQSIIIYDPSTGTHHLAPPGYLSSIYEQTAYPAQQYYSQPASNQGQAQPQPIMMYPNSGLIPFPCSQDGAYYGPPSLQQCFSGASIAPMVNSNELAPMVEPMKHPDKVDDLSWEERTRLAWERIRGGVEAAFNMDSARQKDDKTPMSGSIGINIESPSSPVNQQQQHPNTDSVNIPLEQWTRHMQKSSSSSPKHPMSIVQRTGSPPKILGTHSGEMRRVTFGEAQEHIFYDDQDENRSEMTYPDPYRRKKKRRFRGTRLISGVFEKVKHSAVHLARSRSADSQLSAVSIPSSQESDHSNLSRVLSDQSSSSSSAQRTNLHRQSQPQSVNPLREQNGRFP